MAGGVGASDGVLSLPDSVRVHVYTQPTDMRKGFYGLAAIVEEMGHRVLDGHLFVFLSRRRDRAKVLWWARGGYCLFYKRLERGRFPRPEANQDGRLQIDAGQLSMLLDGIDFSQVPVPARWKPKTST